MRNISVARDSARAGPAPVDPETVREWSIVDATISRDKFIDY
jgi:hypothetical protein